MAQSGASSSFWQLGIVVLAQNLGFMCLAHAKGHDSGGKLRVM